MPRYSPEFKEQIISKLMPPHNRTVASVSRETGVSRASLYNWKKQFRAQGYVVPKKPTIAEHWDGKAKLAAVIQTAMLNEAERSEYCCKHGLYPEQLEAWKAAFHWHRCRTTLIYDRGLPSSGTRVDLHNQRLTMAAPFFAGPFDFFAQQPAHYRKGE